VLVPSCIGDVPGHAGRSRLPARRPGRWWSRLVGLFAVILIGSVAPSAFARGPRQVPDLRRDASSWTRPASIAALRLPITLHIATDAGAPVATRARVLAWVDRANRALARYGIEVVVREVRHLPAGFDTVARWQDRRGLAAYAPTDGTVHVFVTEDLDGGRRSRRVRGLHWRYRGLRADLRAREYVVVTSSAPGTTLAHELGHLLGLRHTVRDDNIMCSCRRGDDVGFDDVQGLAMRQVARRRLASDPPPPRGLIWRRD
jgi:hypothetical protein